MYLYFNEDPNKREYNFYSMATNTIFIKTKESRTCRDRKSAPLCRLGVAQSFYFLKTRQRYGRVALSTRSNSLTRPRLTLENDLSRKRATPALRTAKPLLG